MKQETFIYFVKHLFVNMYVQIILVLFLVTHLALTVAKFFYFNKWNFIFICLWFDYVS